MENVALRNLYETRNNRLFRFSIIYKYIIYSASLLVNVAKYLTHPYLQSIIYAQRYQLFDIVIVWDSTLLFLKKIPKQRKWMRPKDLCLNNVGKSIITLKFQEWSLENRMNLLRNFLRTRCLVRIFIISYHLYFIQWTKLHH